MAQVTDRTVGANPTGFDMRTELNNIIGALESDNSGSSEPLNTVAYMKWLDTSNATYYYYKERNHDNTAWVTLFRYTVATKVMEVVSNGVVLSQTDIANEIHASGSKTTPVDADEIGLIDSASSNILKKLTWANLKSTLFSTSIINFLGNIGIGENNPFTPLVVSKDDTASSLGTSAASIHIINKNSSVFGRIAELIFNITGQTTPIAAVSAKYSNYGTTYAGELILSTNAGAGAGLIERLKIDKDGNVTVGGTGLLAIGQTWQDVTGSRALGVTYTNTSGKPIYVNVFPGAIGVHEFIINGAVRNMIYMTAGNGTGMTMIVQNGETYSVTGGTDLVGWWELR